MKIKTLKLATVFTGIDAVGHAAKRVYGHVKHVFACEIDKFARESFLANNQIDIKHFHKDIRELDGTAYRGEVDVLAGGSPCQSFSIAGLRKGTADDRGGLIYEYIRVVSEVKAPVIIYENVKGILSIDNGSTIREFIKALREIGYHCHYEVLNSKDYGVPQNRERFFLVGFLDLETYHAFSFAPKKPLGKRLKDVLERDVDRKYFLSPTLLAGFREHNKSVKRHSDNSLKVFGTLSTKGLESNNRVYDPSGIAPTLTTMQGGGREPKIVVKYEIRKLTPRECLRLQGFDDTFKIVVSDTQLYKQAGNSMTATVLEMIFNQIESAKIGKPNSGTLLDFLC